MTGKRKKAKSNRIWRTGAVVYVAVLMLVALSMLAVERTKTAPIPGMQSVKLQFRNG